MLALICCLSAVVQKTRGARLPYVSECGIWNLSYPRNILRSFYMFCSTPSSINAYHIERRCQPKNSRKVVGESTW